MHFGISLGTKFELKAVILISWKWFLQKGYVCSKTKRVNINNELSIFELVSTPIKLTSSILDQTCLKKLISGVKLEKLTVLLSYAYLNECKCQF